MFGFWFQGLLAMPFVLFDRDVLCLIICMCLLVVFVLICLVCCGLRGFVIVLYKLMTFFDLSVAFVVLFVF